MYIVHVVVGETVVDRSIFDTIYAASEYARLKVREKVWKLADNTVYYGNVVTNIYEIDFEKTTDYRDEHILSFS